MPRYVVDEDAAASPCSGADACTTAAAAAGASLEKARALHKVHRDGAASAEASAIEPSATPSSAPPLVCFSGDNLHIEGHLETSGGAASDSDVDCSAPGAATAVAAAAATDDSALGTGSFGGLLLLEENKRLDQLEEPSAGASVAISPLGARASGVLNVPAALAALARLVALLVDEPRSRLPELSSAPGFVGDESLQSTHSSPEGYWFPRAFCLAILLATVAEALCRLNLPSTS
mmetsp:Transcript_93649/g.303166  ORF Transcript_93649/g.303166 Transcript_93649/m.303166 type:complete len:234 (-) Transcript_93649:648-1349(-)